MKHMTLSLLIVLMAVGAFSQQTIQVHPYFKNNFLFESGFWVYQDTAELTTDSITLESAAFGSIPPNPAFNHFQEFYLMNMRSHTFDLEYNEFIITSHWRRNGGGEFGELGQPFMHIQEYENLPQVGNGFNGYEIMEILDEMEVNGVPFSNVVWSRVYADEQHQHEFDFDTDLWFAPGVGIIRKAWTDGQDVDHVWELINWQVSGYTSIAENSIPEKQVIIFPNPAKNKATVYALGMERLELLDLKGNIVKAFDRQNISFEIDLHGLSSGVYLVKVFTANGVDVTKMVIE
jgi:hypothetical protein